MRPESTIGSDEFYDCEEHKSEQDEVAIEKIDEFELQSQLSLYTDQYVAFLK